MDLSLLNQLETTGTNAFANNLFQGDLVIGPSFVSIKTSAFSGIPFNGVLDLSNASNLEEIATKAFFQSKFSTLIFPTNGKLNSIGDQTFHNSSITMNDFYLPNTLEKIGVSGFSGCKFNNIYIPLSVAEIGGSAFNESKTATFYYEGSSIPTGWSSNWNNHKRPVVFDAIF